MSCVVAEAFRCDREHTFIVSTFDCDIPVAAVELMLERARKELEPFEDGSPLSSAVVGPVRPSRPDSGRRK